MRNVRALLPKDATCYHGDDWVPYFHLAISLVITARSLIHIFRPDGGAGSIAGIDLEVEGGENIVAIFAQWGLEQLLLAGLAWLALLRYRGLIPLVLLIDLLDSIGRIAVGRSKPLRVEKPSPGAYGSWIALPLLATALWYSLLPAQEQDQVSAS